MELTSTAFSDCTAIPARFTCDGEKVSPQLTWTGVPAGTQSLVLVVEDPDVPRNLRPDGLFVHWLVWNIPPSVTTIAENSQPAGVPGLNSAGQIGYVPPCPPHGVHRYYFRIYALDAELTLPSAATKGELLQAMDGHVLDQGELMGRYEKKPQ